MQLQHRRRQPLEVVHRSPDKAIGVTGRANGSVGPGGHSSDHQILDSVPVENLNEAVDVRFENGARPGV